MATVSDDPKAEPLAEPTVADLEAALDATNVPIAGEGDEASGAGAVSATTADEGDTGALLLDLQAENARLKEQAARTLADYQNLERRVQADRARAIEWARMTIYEGLLQPLEHLDLAAAALHDKGLDMVVDGFWQVLGEGGLQKIAPQGEKFDVNTMEAVEKVGEGETVTEVVAPGFRLGEQVLRPAKVKVG